jgi:hypothetical protein
MLSLLSPFYGYMICIIIEIQLFKTFSNAFIEENHFQREFCIPLL